MTPRRRLGPGVTYVSSTPINTAEGQGRDIIYAFRDINQLHLAETPPAPGGLSVSSSTLNTQRPRSRSPDQPDRRRVSPREWSCRSCRLTPSAGNATRPRRQQLPSADQMAMHPADVRRRAHILAVEPAGQLIRTSSPYVDGRRVTLVDVNLDSLLRERHALAAIAVVEIAGRDEGPLESVPGVKAEPRPRDHDRVQVTTNAQVSALKSQRSQRRQVSEMRVSLLWLPELLSG